MQGNNPIRPPVKGSGDSLDVQEIFLTIQGEGPFAGVPAVFIRLGGCNLACGFCDTEFESFANMSLAAILAEVEAVNLHAANLIVITGGEPFRQPIEKLCSALLAKGMSVQIETNGTIYRDIAGEADIVCSPKNTGRGYVMLREDLLKRLSAIKFIVSAHDPLYADIAEVGQSRFCIPVYIQPMDEGDSTRNCRNAAYAAELALKHRARLSLQMHKVIGMR